MGRRVDLLSMLSMLSIRFWKEASSVSFFLLIHVYMMEAFRMPAAFSEGACTHPVVHLLEAAQRR